jgi:hypothetical protein
VSKDFAGIALPIAVAWFVAGLPSGVINGIRAGIAGGLSGTSSADPMTLALLNAGGAVISSFVSIIVQAFILGGIVQFALRVARGEKPEFGVVFSGGRYFAPMLGASILYYLGLTVGFMACIVPALFLAACFIAYSAFVVDKNLGAVDALKASWQATTPHRTNIIIYILLTILVYLAGTLACCVGALLVSLPVVSIGNAYIYLKLIGEQPRLPNA